MNTVKFNDQILELQQEAYISNDGAHYEALATDSNDNKYLVTWAITVDNPDECDDESNMCDWDKYNVIPL